MSNLDKKYNLVYVTIDTLNWKLYIGDHSTNNINDNYLGTGKYILRAIKKYGKENFIRLDLEYFNTKKEAFIAQEKYIREFKTLSTQNGYNISPKGGHQCINSLSPETIELIKSKNKISSKGERNGMFGKHHTKKSKKLIGLASIGRKFSLEAREKMSKPNKNKIMSKHTRKLISDAISGKPKIFKKVKCPYCNLIGKGPNMTRYHFNNCKFKE